MEKFIWKVYKGMQIFILLYVQSTMRGTCKAATSGYITIVFLCPLCYLKNVEIFSLNITLMKNTMHEMKCRTQEL